MIHAAAPHFLWPFAVRYAAHQLNLWPRVSLPKTLLTLRWTGKVGNASVFRVWGSRAFVRDTFADKLSARAIPCVFLGLSPDAPGCLFYHPTSLRVFPSQDVTFDESVPFYRLFPFHSAPLPPPPLFLAPGPPPVDPLPPQGPAPSGVSQVDPPPSAVPGEVAVDSSAIRGTASGGAETGGSESGGAALGGTETRGSETGGAEPGGAQPGGAELEGVEPGGAESEGAESGGAEAQGAAEDVRAASASGTRRSSKGKGGKGGGSGSGGGGGGSGGGGGDSGGGGCGGSGGGTGGFGGGGGGGSGGSGGSGSGGSGGGRTGAWGGVAIFELDYDAILSAMYALSASAEGDCYLSVLPDPGIGVAALGASESSLPGTAHAEVLHTFTLDSGASRYFFRDSTTLTPLPAPVPVRLAYPFGGPVVARYSTVRSSPPLVLNELGQVAPPCSCHLLSHQTLLWHHRLGHPSLPRLRGMHSCLLGHERYFLLVVDDNTRYTTVFPLSNKGEFPDVLIPWIRLQLRERFCLNLRVLRLHFDTGGVFSSDLLREFCHGEGILESFTLPASPQQNGISECRFGLVMEVAPTSMVHATAPHFLWTFAVRMAAVLPPYLAPCPPLSGRGGRERGSAEPAGVEPGGAVPTGAESGGADPGGAETEGEDSGGAKPGGAESERYFFFWRFAAVSPWLTPRPEPLSLQQLFERLTRRTRLRTGAAGAGGSAAGDAGAGGAEGAGVSAGAGGPGGTGPGGARSGGTGAAEAGGAGGARARCAGARVAGARGAASLGAGGDGASAAGGSGAAGAGGAADVGAGGLGRGGAGVGSRDTGRLRREGDPDAPDIPTPRSYAETVTGSRGRRVLRLACYVARGFSQGQGVDYFQTFSPTPNMTTLWVFRHVVAQRDYKLHSLDFSIAFLQGSLHEEIWLRHPPGFTGSFLQIYVNNKALIALCQEHRLEQQQRGQLRLAYVATRANIADIFTKALPPACFAFLDWSCDHLFSPTLRMGSCSSSVFSSSCEAKIYPGAMAAQELRWLTYLLTDLREGPRSSLVLYVDNKAMIALCQEHKLEHRTKHIAQRYFLARELHVKLICYTLFRL
ncbi:unnamed protein product [Closterium sp. NIES-53]